MSAGVMRPMAEPDLDQVLAWRNLKQVRENMYTHHVISPQEHRAWWERSRNDSSTRLFMFEMDGVAAGVITFSRYSGPDGVATWAFYSGDTSRRGIGSAMELAALRHAFGELRVRKLECEVLDFNDKVTTFHLKHGFRVEGIFRDAYVRDGAHHDIWRLAMYRKDWERAIRRVLEERAERRGNPSDLTGKSHEQAIAVTPERVRAFAEASGDANPIHLDAAAARAAGFDGPIAHGVLGLSFFSAILGTRFPGAGTVYLGQDARFLAPVPVGADARVRIQVLTHIGRRIYARTQLLVGETVCIDGYAELLAPPALAT